MLWKLLEQPNRHSGWVLDDLGHGGAGGNHSASINVGTTLVRAGEVQKKPICIPVLP